MPTQPMWNHSVSHFGPSHATILPNDDLRQIHHVDGGGDGGGVGIGGMGAGVGVGRGTVAVNAEAIAGIGGTEFVFAEMIKIK